MESPKKKGRGRKIFEEIIAEIFPNLMKTINPQIKKFQQTPSTRNTHTQNYKAHNNLIKLPKGRDKEKIWKEPRGGKKIHYIKIKIMMTTYFLWEIRKLEDHVVTSLKYWKEKNCQPRII